MKNVTLSADERAIEAARQKARRNKTTLNAEFRRWLQRYADDDHTASQRLNEYRRVMAELSGVATGAGRRFTREDMNER